MSAETIHDEAKRLRAERKEIARLWDIAWRHAFMEQETTTLQTPHVHALNHLCRGATVPKSLRAEIKKLSRKGKKK